jgi:hypothetical protein
MADAGELGQSSLHGEHHMADWTWAITLIVSYFLFYGSVLMTTFLVGCRKGWPFWINEVVADAASIPFFIVMAIIGLRVVEWPGGWAFLIVDGILAGEAAWRIWKAFRDNRKGQWAPSLLGKVVINLGHRLSLGDAR